MAGFNLAQCAAARLTRFVAAFGALLCALLSTTQAARAQADPVLVKATFLYRFSSYVTWPARAAPDSPIVICVMDNADFRAQLSRLVGARGAEGRAFAVRRIDQSSDVRLCSIAYLNSDEDRVRQVLRAAVGAPVLTVTDASITPNVRGVVHFVTVDNRIRFHIDDVQASEHGLGMDSRLLALAVTVRRRA